jgi:hypothetical protein
MFHVNVTERKSHVLRVILHKLPYELHILKIFIVQRAAEKRAIIKTTVINSNTVLTKL